MSYPLLALISVIIFASIHLWANQAKKITCLQHGRFLSAGGGIAIAYVFVDLLPKLSESDDLIRNTFKEMIPFIERHAYVMALIGFLLFFMTDRSRTVLKKPSAFWLSLSSYALFNFLIGYAIVDKSNPEVQPLVLFTIAIALHYFVNDYELNETYGEIYQKKGKWVLIAALFLGWFAGLGMTISPTAIALVSAFIGGGVIMNVTRHELPTDKPNSSISFLLSALIYTAILLSVG